MFTASFHCPKVAKKCVLTSQKNGFCVNRSSLVFLCAAVAHRQAGSFPSAPVLHYVSDSPTKRTLSLMGFMHILTASRCEASTHIVFFFFSCLVANEKGAGCFFEGEENKSLSLNNNPLSSNTGLAVSQTFMFLQSCAAKCVTSAQLTFVVIGP